MVLSFKKLFFFALRTSTLSFNFSFGFESLLNLDARFLIAGFPKSIPHHAVGDFSEDFQDSFCFGLPFNVL